MEETALRRPIALAGGSALPYDDGQVIVAIRRRRHRRTRRVRPSGRGSRVAAN